MGHVVTPGIHHLSFGLHNVTEAGLNMLAAAAAGVPTLVVHGDAAACQEAAALMPGIRRVFGWGRDPDEVIRHTREVFSAVARAFVCEGVAPILPVEATGVPLVVHDCWAGPIEVDAADAQDTYKNLLDVVTGRSRQRNAEVRAADPLPLLEP